MWDSLEMGTLEGRLQKIFCVRAGDETGRFDLEELEVKVYS